MVSEQIEKVVLGPDPRSKGRALNPREVGKLERRYQKAGEEYFSVRYPSGASFDFPAKLWTIIEE